MKVAGVLLGASVLLNIALLARRPAPEPVPRRAPDAPPRHAVEAPLPAAAPEPPRPPAPPKPEARTQVPAEDVAPPDRLAGFRGKLARALRFMRDPRRFGGADPEARLEYSEVSLAFQRAMLERWKDPRAYMEILETLLEEIAAETKGPLDEARRAELRRTLEDYERTLSGLADADAWERYRCETGPEAEILQRLRAFATPEQEARVSAFGALSPWSAAPAPWVDRRRAEAQVVRQWSAAYELDAAQTPAVEAAARLYLRAMDAVNAQLGAAPGRETPEWRRRSAEALLDALGALESSLAPEQRERLRARRPAEVRVYDATALRR